ncbi:MAG: hypothetical protein B7X06_04145 [Verrucomicrobia bacterium 21-51-4]|nr:MAG: hypothetical protein B7X06_04145 [Verrucomicrobia bacterium 21-51-4]
MSIEGNLIEEAFAELAKIKQAPMSENYPLEEGLWRIEEPLAQPDSTLHFRLTHFRNTEDTALTHASFQQPSLTTLWTADIRDRAFKLGAQKIQKISQRLWMSLLIAMGLMAILIVGEFTWAVQNWRVNRMNRTIEAREDQVLAIEADQVLIEKLERFAKFELSPFNMLDVLSSSKPRSMYFTQITAQELTKIEVRGIAGSVDEVNAYTDTIRHQPTIQSAELADIQSRQGKVTFTLNVDFNEAAWSKAPEEPEAEETPGPTPETEAPQEQPATSAENAAAPSEEVPPATENTTPTPAPGNEL